MITYNVEVFYYLGIAHVLGKHNILLTRYEDDIPFDIRQLGYELYEDSGDLYDIIDKKEDLIRNQLNYARLSRLSFNPIWGEPKENSKYSGDIFMVMPFGNKGANKFYSKGIKENLVAAMNGVTINRGDDFFESQQIVDDIWAALCNAKLIIADISEANPNAYYEIGIAQTLGKRNSI